MMHQPRSYSLILSGLLLASMLVGGCDSSSDEDTDIDLGDPSTLVGRYALVSVVDKQGDLSGEAGILFEAGEPRSFTQTENGQTFNLNITVDGELELTAQRYTFAFTITVTTAQFPPFSETEEDEGTWSVSGNTLTLDSDSDMDGPDQLSISASGNRITIEDETARFIFQKR